jgi:hypothetical protein
MEVGNMLAADDKHYQVQQEIGDEVLMDFTVPDDFTPGGSIFLHSKGYYHAVVDKEGNSELAFIWSFLKPGRLSEYSYENYLRFQELLAEKD